MNNYCQNKVEKQPKPCFIFLLSVLGFNCYDKCFRQSWPSCSKKGTWQLPNPNNLTTKFRRYVFTTGKKLVAYFLPHQIFNDTITGSPWYPTKNLNFCVFMCFSNPVSVCNILNIE